MIAAARQGDPVACRELGRRYLHGTDGFPRHQRTALSYLTSPATRSSPEAALILVEGLTLEELLLTGHEATLRRVAVSGNQQAQIRVAAWLLVRHGDSEDARAWLSVCADSGNVVAREALSALQSEASVTIASSLLALHCGANGSDIARLNAIAARKALDSGEPSDAVRCVGSIAALAPLPTHDLAEITLSILDLASAGRLSLGSIPTSWIETCLRCASDRGDPRAHYYLGRAMCSIPSGRLAPRQLTLQPNLRWGSALLLRSADGGLDEAWLHLYCLHAASKSSVANPPLARVFLEKAARRGHRSAQRILGALLLGEAVDMVRTEQAVSWLHLAAESGDSEATGLLETLVVRPDGRDAEACEVLSEIRSRDPLIASRLLLARHFGLTKREATLVDPAIGQRSWGLVVERNPYFVKPGLRAARAVPILSAAARRSLHWAASIYQDAGPPADAADSDVWEKRIKRMNRVIKKHHVEPSLFFANITSDALEIMRGGPRWATSQRARLKSALSFNDHELAGKEAAESGPIKLEISHRRRVRSSSD